MQAENQIEESLKEIGDLKAALDEHALMSITDLQGKITYVNDKFCAVSRYAREELIGQDHRIVNSGHHSAEFMRELWTTLARGRAWQGEIRNKARDGSFYWEAATIVPTLDKEGKPTRYVSIRTDITERKSAEDELVESGDQLRALLGRLQRTREEERLLVSQKLREQLGQPLAGLKTNLGWLERRLLETGDSRAPNPVLECVGTAYALADSTIVAVQRMAAELCPDALRRFGLAAALGQELRLLQERGEFHCLARVTEPTPALPPEIASELFHVGQAALSNVVRHAQATQVEVRLHSAGGAVFLEVSDDGVGIEVTAVNAPRSLGLLGMKERVARCGGTLAFTRNVPHGTRLLVRIPHATTSGTSDPLGGSPGLGK